MSVRLKNTANDRSKAHLHRAALRFEPEPVLAGRRIRLDETITIPDELYEKNKKLIDGWVAMGVISVDISQVPLTKIIEMSSVKDLSSLSTVDEVQRIADTAVFSTGPASKVPDDHFSKKLDKDLDENVSKQAAEIAKEVDAQFLKDVEKQLSEEAAKLASVETQTPLTMGGEVTITETLPPAEVLAEIAPPPVPNVPLGMTKEVAVLDEKQDLLPPKKTETTPPAETSASAPAETKKGKKKLF
jgi:hypothetical protein